MIPQGSINDASVFISLFVSVITPHVMNKLGIDNIYFGLVFSCIVQLIGFIISKTTHNSDMTGWIRDLRSVDIMSLLLYVVLPIIVCLVIWYVFYHSRYLVITINSDSDQHIFTDYIRDNLSYYETIVNSEIGDLDKVSQDILYKPNKDDDGKLKHYLVPQLDQKVNFNDPYLGITGYFVWRTKSFKASSSDNKLQKSITLRYVELHILKKKIFNIVPFDIKAMLKKMKKSVKDLRRNKKITLHYIKVVLKNFPNNGVDEYGVGNCIRHFYKGPRQSLDAQEKIYMQTFFHPVRDQLWEFVKSNCLRNDTYQSVGQCGRVSLLLYGPPGTGKSSFIYRIAMCLYRSVISLDLRDLTKADLYSYFQYPCRAFLDSYRDAIHVFEEFDISIKAIQEREIKNKNKENVPQITKRDKDGNIIIQYQDDRINITLRDLLELFQGPIPLDRSIIIATTNKYEEINTICPDLFRQGRMNPIYVGFINKETLQEISMYFFSKQIKCRLPNEITISTSAIIDLAMEIKMNGLPDKDKHSEFVTKLCKLLS
jgi:hypothetical protein